MLTARKEREDKEQSFEVVHGSKGSVVEIRGLADAMNAARLRNLALGEPARTIEGWRNCGAKRKDCLSERMRKA